MKTLKTIGQFIYVNYKEILTYAGAALGGGALGIIIMALIIVTTSSSEDPTGYAALGACFALGLALVVFFFAQSLGGQADFYVTVSMNRARVPYFLGRYILLIIDMLAAVGVTWLVSKLEMNVIGPALSRSGEVEQLLKGVNPAVFIALLLSVPLVIILFTALYVLFERKFFWVLWGIYMIAALGGPRISTAMKNSPDSAPAKIGQAFVNLMNLGTTAWIIIGAVSVVIFLVADIMLYKKMAVKL